jgi:hypothetical protein
MDPRSSLNLLLELAARKIKRQSDVFNQYTGSLSTHITITFGDTTTRTLVRKQIMSEISSFNADRCELGNSNTIPGLVGTFSKNRATQRPDPIPYNNSVKDIISYYFS